MLQMQHLGQVRLGERKEAHVIADDSLGVVHLRAHRVVAECNSPSLFQDRLGGIWEVATTANLAEPRPTGLKMSL